jgi:hypothetical protein
MRAKHKTFISNEFRHMLIKVIITIITLFLGYYTTFVVFRRTTSDSSLSGTNGTTQIQNSE